MVCDPVKTMDCNPRINRLLSFVILQERLDARLHQLQAREMGICPIRRDLYSQTFGIFTDAKHP